MSAAEVTALRQKQTPSEIKIAAKDSLGAMHCEWESLGADYL